MNISPTNNMIKFLTAGHYHFKSDIYKNLIFKMNKKINFQKKLDTGIEQDLKQFY